jgi:hypothetical protein
MGEACSGTSAPCDGDPGCTKGRIAGFPQLCSSHACGTQRLVTSTKRVNVKFKIVRVSLPVDRRNKTREHSPWSPMQ